MPHPFSLWQPGYPPGFSDLEAWYDSLDPVTMLASNGVQVTDGGTVCLWKDKSGNSGTVCYVSNVAASNSVSSPNKSVTGNQTFTLDVGLDDYTPSGDLTLVSKLSGNDGFAILVLTTGVVRLRVGDGASVTNVDSSAAFTMTDLRRHTIGIAWTDGVGASFTQDGAAIGTAVVAAKTLTNAAVSCTIGTITGRIYRVQVGSVYDFNPASTTAKKLANGDTLTTGGDVWTLTSSGATGARIAGERDEYNGVLANRPVYLNYAGTKYGWTRGAITDYFSSPDSTKLRVAGDLDLIMIIKPAALTGTTQELIGKAGTGAQRAYRVQITTNGYLQLLWSADGSTIIVATSTTPISASAVTAGAYVRTKLDVDDGGVYKVYFYESADGTWGAPDSTVTGGATTSIFAGAGSLTICASPTITAAVFTGAVYRAQVWDGFSDAGGTLVADFNPALYTSGTTFTASTGEAWTVNGGAHIVTRSILYGDGSNDSMKAAADGVGQPITCYWVGEMSSWTANDYLFDGNATNSGAAFQAGSSPAVNITAGSSVAANSGMTLKTFGVFTAVLNGANSSLTFNRLTPATGNAGAANMNGTTILARGAGDAGWLNGCIGEFLKYSGAHAVPTSHAIVSWMGRKWSFAA